MTKQEKIEVPSGTAFARLSEARQRFHTTELKKSGKHAVGRGGYFELGDFLVPALKIFHECGIVGIVSFDRELARLHIHNVDDPSDTIVIQSPLGSANLKGCHEVQNIGAVQTYQRRYLWMAALEVIEHDALDGGPPAQEGQSQGDDQGAVSPPALPENTATEIIALAGQVGKNELGIILNAYSVGDIRDLTEKQAQAVIKRLNEKLAAKKEKADA